MRIFFFKFLLDIQLMSKDIFCQLYFEDFSKNASSVLVAINLCIVVQRPQSRDYIF